MTCNWESNNTDVETRDVFWSSTFEPQYFSAGTYKSSLRWQKKCYTWRRPKLLLRGDYGQDGVENKKRKNVEGYLKKKSLATFR